jgi:hypothetical protein
MMFKLTTIQETVNHPPEKGLYQSGEMYAQDTRDLPGHRPK